MSPTKVLITGATTGIGYETTKSLLASPTVYSICLCGTSLAKAETAAKTLRAEFPSSPSRVWPVYVDVEDDESIRGAFEVVVGEVGGLDVLINNAGAQFDPQYDAGSLTMRQLWTKSWSVNTIGAQIMTHTFAPLLINSPDGRVVFLASGTSSLQITEVEGAPINASPAKGWPKVNNPVSSIPAYRSAKAGLNMLMREWHRQFKNDNVKVFSISPGFLATNLGNGREKNKSFGAQDPSTAGAFILSVMQGERDADAGKVLLKDSVQAW